MPIKTAEWDAVLSKTCGIHDKQYPGLDVGNIPGLTVPQIPAVVASYPSSSEVSTHIGLQAFARLKVRATQQFWCLGVRKRRQARPMP
jgi:hypothetical protein